MAEEDSPDGQALDFPVAFLHRRAKEVERPVVIAARRSGTGDGRDDGSVPGVGLRRSAGTGPLGKGKLQAVFRVVLFDPVDGREMHAGRGGDGLFLLTGIREQEDARPGDLAGGMLALAQQGLELLPLLGRQSDHVFFGFHRYGVRTSPSSAFFRVCKIFVIEY